MVAIRTFDALNNVLQTALCGLITTTSINDPSYAPPRLSLNVKDFVGVWGGKYVDDPNYSLTWFGFTKYV